MSSTQIVRPRIYVACLASYEAGILHGAWIDAGGGAWDMWQRVQKMLEASPVEGAEEFAILNHEGFGAIRIGRFDGLERVATIAALVMAHGDQEAATIGFDENGVAEARDAPHCGSQRQFGGPNATRVA